MQRKNYITVLIGIVALAGLVASGCEHIPTGTYNQTPGDNIVSLATTLPVRVIQGAVVGGPFCGDGTLYEVIGQISEEDCTACLSNPQPCCADCSCPSILPIQFMATAPDGADTGFCPSPMCYALADVSQAQDGSILTWGWTDCTLPPEVPAQQGPATLTLIP